MKIDSVLRDLTTSVRQLIAAMQRKLTLTDNVSCVIVEVADTGAANVQFTLNHNLGRIPTRYFYSLDKAGDIYDSSRGTWTTSAMTLKCSVANAHAYLVVF